MRAAEETDVGGQESSRANGDFACVQDGSVEIDEDVLAQLDVRAVVDADGRFEPWIFGEELLVFFFGCCLGRERCFISHDSSLRSAKLWHRGCCAVDYSLSPYFDSLSSTDFAGVVVLLAGKRTSSPPVYHLRCESIVELATELAGLVFGHRHVGEFDYGSMREYPGVVPSVDLTSLC